MVKKDRLFDQFPPVSTEEWMDKIKADLKGRDFDRKLVWKTGEGFDVKPFYREEDIASLPYINTPPGEFPFLRGICPGRNGWFKRQDIRVEDPAAANSKALDILNRGIDSLGFVFGAETDYSPGLMESLLEGIYCESIELNFFPQGKAKELFRVFDTYIKDKGVKPGLLRGAIETDPLGRLMVKGSLCVPVSDGLDYLADLVKETEHLENFRVLGINGSAFGNAGSGIVQELAYSMAMGNEYISQLSERGIEPGLAARSMGFTFGIGSNYFMEIARLRAARVLWARIVDAWSPSRPDDCKIYVHSVTSEWNKTLYDPYVNMLRTQTEAMSATLGGTNSLTVKPFDSVFRQPTEFSERVARNQQLMLMEESHFDKVNDPSAGSYYIENLTSSITGHAWELFVETEEGGGFLESLKKGDIQAGVKKTAARRKENVRRRKEKLLGTNIYPDADEKIKEPYAAGKMDADADYDVEPLQPARAAEEFETMRMAVDRLDRTPVVFLLTIGNPAMRKARAQFAHGFFGCAGYEIIDNLGFEDAETAVKAAREAGADITVICSSDEEYADYAPRVYSLLNGESIVVVAGEPPCMDELRSKGIDHFISMRSNLLETLMDYNRELGIK